MIYRIYTIRRLGDPVVRWVGMTSMALSVRLSGHVSAAKGYRTGIPFSRWLLANRDNLKIEHIASASDRWSAADCERAIIQQAVSAGDPVFNTRGVPRGSRILAPLQKEAA